MEKRLLVPTKNAKGILENLSSGMPMAEWKMSSPTSVQNARRLWEQVEWRGGKGQFYATDLCYRFSDLLPLPPRLVVHLVTGVKALF